VAERRDARKRHLLDAAAHLFREQGYAPTTIREIGAAAGLAHAATHYSFGSKAGLLYGIYEEAFADIDEQFRGLEDLAPADAIVVVVRTILVQAARRPDHWAVFYQELRWLEQHLPDEMCKPLRRRERQFVGRLMKIVKRGVDEGSLREVDPLMAVSDIIGSAAWAHYWYRPKQALSPDFAEPYIEQYIDLVLRGLLP
jgi:AcrR family transcriptional regulator